jgi:Skp family chaperone for outer membrane proteins
MAALVAGAFLVLPTTASAVCQFSDIVLLDYADRYVLMLEGTTALSKNQEKGIKRVNKDCRTALKDNDKCASREVARQQNEKNFGCNEIDDKSGKKSCKKDNKNEKKAQQDVIKANRKLNQQFCDEIQDCVEVGDLDPDECVDEIGFPDIDD